MIIFKEYFRTAQLIRFKVYNLVTPFPNTEMPGCGATPSLSANFLIYVLSKQLSSTIFKQMRELKKPYFLQHPFTDTTKKRKIRKEGETSLDFNPLQSISEEARKSFHN